MIYACCLEDAKLDQADEAFAKLQQAYFDWNEVRVTTVIELGEALKCLPNATQAGHRIKRCLQSLFEARYNYDVDDLKKANLGKATEEIAAWKGVTPFILNYICQHALGGHSIPVDTASLDALVAADILTDAEAEKRVLPGVERAIPKNKGTEFACLLHQFGVDYQQSPKSPIALAVFKDLGVTPKAKKVVPPPPAKIAKGTEKASTTKPVPSVLPAKKQETKSAQAKPATGSKAKDSKDTSSITGEKSKAPSAKSEPIKAQVKKPASQGDVKSEPKKQETKKPDSSKVEAKKVVAKPAAKKEATPAKDTKNKPAPAKAPEPKSKVADPKKSSKEVSPKNKPVDSKATPAKKIPTKGGSDKQATNVKMTKKKPR